MNPYKNNYTASIALALLIAFFIISIKVLMVLITYYNSIRYHNLITFGYFVVLIITFILYAKFKNNSLLIAIKILGFPITFLVGFYMLIQPVFLVLFTSLFYSLFSIALPCFLYKLNDLYQFVVLNNDTTLYLIITSASIIAILFVEVIKKLIYWTPVFMQLSNNNKIKAKELIDFVLTQKQIRFSIYLLYLVYLLIYSLGYFEGHIGNANSNHENTIMQAFITFLAFDSLVSNFNPFINPKELLSKILATMSSFLPELIEEKNENTKSQTKEEK